MSKKQWEPYNVKAITRSFELIFKQHDIEMLTKDAYRFAHLYLGFIAHYNLHGFRDTYREDLRSFAYAISIANVDRYKEDSWFENEYGAPYCNSIYEIGSAAIEMAKNSLNAIRDKQYDDERIRAQQAIDNLKKKYNL